MDLALAAERFKAHNAGKERASWRGAWLKWALDERSKPNGAGNGQSGEYPEHDEAKAAARIAGMIAAMVKSGKRLFPMAVSDRQLVAACRANTLPRELLEDWLGPSTAAEMLNGLAQHRGDG